jgi:uncharacterized 2Fe-2S/4Fe-4S cluster protein (DUF4445 family)
MKIHIAPGCSVNLSDGELALASKIKAAGILDQDRLSSDEMIVIIKLVNKNVVRRRNRAGKVSYEIGPNIDW